MFDQEFVLTQEREAKSRVQQYFVEGFPLEANLVHPEDKIAIDAIAALYCAAASHTQGFCTSHLEQAAINLMRSSGGVSIKLTAKGTAIICLPCNRELCIKSDRLVASGLMTLLRNWAAEVIRKAVIDDLDLSLNLAPVEIISDARECEAFLAFYRAPEAAVETLSIEVSTPDAEDKIDF